MKRKITNMRKCLFFVLLFAFYCFGCAAPQKKVKSAEPVQKQKYTNYKKLKTIIPDYNKQIEYYMNRLKTDQNNPELNYNLASIHLTLKDFKKSDYHINKAIKYAKKRGEKEIFKAFQGKIVRDAYKSSILKNSIEDYKMFLDLFASSLYEEDINDRLEELMYQEAINKNKKELYVEFLWKFPSSIHLQSINDHLDELAFEEALRTNTIKKYQEFIKENMFSNFREAALERIDRLRLENVQMIDTIEAYGGFIQKFPANKYTEKAKARINELKFERIEEKRDIDKLGEYIKENPQGVFVDLSLESIDELRYQEAKSYDTKEALEEFINRYPDSAYISRAKKGLDVLMYEEVEKEDSIEAFKVFLEKHPNSRFKYDVRERLEVLEKQERIKRFCDDADRAASRGNYKKAEDFYKKAVNVAYSSRAHYALGSLFETMGDEESHYKKKIENYYKASTEFKIVLRKDQYYSDISTIYDKLLEKRSAEQQIMNQAMLRKQKLPSPFTAKLINYSKKPIIVFSNAGTKSAVFVEITYKDRDTKTRLRIMPQTEMKRAFYAGNINLNIKSTEEEDTKHSLELFYYFEYSLRVK